jgi:hypothetical protein
LNVFLNRSIVQIHPSQCNGRKLAGLPMNMIDGPTPIIGALIGEPSWADAITAIEKDKDLTPAQKRHRCTSLRQMGRYLDRPLSLIPARIAAIGPAVKKLHPARLGVHAKTFANHRANARTALLRFNRQMPEGGRKAPMDASYRALLEQVPNRHARDMLSPFFRFLSGSGVRPEDVRDSHVEGFFGYRKETSF